MSRMSELLEAPQHMYRRTSPDTSREAAAKVTPHLSAIQEKVLLFLYNCPAGATDLDIQRHFEDDGSTYRSRRADLVRMGRVKDSGRKRVQDDTKRIVWELVY